MIRGKSGLPDFLLIGAGKAGTSSVRDLLAVHPGIHMVSDPKEPRFFAKDAVWELGFEWYKALFAGAEVGAVLGEGSPQYTSCEQYPLAANRIAEHLPDAKLLYVVRDPLARTESHWMQILTFHRPRARSHLDALDRYPEMIDSSLYFKRLERYRRYFPDDRIHVMFLEDMKTDAGGVLRRCCRFLGVDPGARIDGACRPRNQSVGRKTVDSESLVRFRASPAFGILKKCVPTRLRIRMKERFFRKKLTERIRFEAAARDRVLTSVADDARGMLAHCGKPADFWPCLLDGASGEPER